MFDLRRRQFITLLGGAATWPVAARAQQAERTRRIGVLMAISEDDPLGQARVAIFRQALAELGWTEGDIVLARQYAIELVRLAPEVILANGTPNVAALQRATTSIPIVFAVVNDP